MIANAFLLLLLLMSSLAIIVEGEDRLFYNEVGIPIPFERYQLWSDLTKDQRDLLANTEGLAYTEETWETPRSNDMEYDSLLLIIHAFTQAYDDAIAFGFTQQIWDCYINHYEGYAWSDLVARDQAKYFKALGWTQQQWDGEIDTIPASEEKLWIRLNFEEKQAAANLCYFQELWDGTPFSTDDWVNTSPFLDAFRTDEPTPAPVATTPAPTDEEDGGGVFGCFPGSSTVSVKGKGMVALHKVKLGDEIMVEKGIYEPIYSFGHYNREAQETFVKVVTTKTTLEITAEHMVFSVHKGIIPASAVEVGDELVDSDGQATLVNKIESVVRQGVYAPFTPSGKLIVDGITVSSYVAFQDSAVLKLGGSIETPFSYHWMAHTFNFPHRFYCQYVASCTEEQYTEDGVSTWVTVPFHVAMWIFRQNAVVMGFCMTVLIAGFSVLAVLEMMPVTSIAILVGYYYASRAKTAKKQL